LDNAPRSLTSEDPEKSNSIDEVTQTQTSWKRNLAVLWIAQVFTVGGFSFSFPFIPFFVQELGIQGEGQASLWAGLVQASMGLAMVATSPIWGLIADRYGRKTNMLRASFGGAIFIFLSAFSSNVYQLMFFRFFTGVFSGTFGPAMALVASVCPRNKLPFAMGILQSAFFTGTTLGPLFGGVIADAWGFQGAFLGTAALLAIAGVIMMIFVREDFDPPSNLSVFQRHAYVDLFHLLTSRELVPVLGTFFVVQFAPVISFVVLPIVIASLATSNVASATGIAFGVTGLAGGLAAYGAGMLTKRVRMTRILTVACVGMCISIFPLFFVGELWQFYFFLACGGIFQGAMLSMGGGLVGLAVPSEVQGAAFGALQSVTVSAFTLAPLTGGGIASQFGPRWVFPAQSACLLGAALLARLLLAARTEKRT
jgi:DHA1 family multidrug resistance protein-like MFS transporter